jgi:acetyl esterase
MTLDSAALALVAQFREMGVKPYNEMTPQEARAFTENMRPQPRAEPRMARQIDRRIPVTGGSLRARLLIPQGNLLGVIVYYHGGGWLLGALEDFDLLARRLAHETDCAVALVDYRLAPEYRFPTAVEDCYAALCWIDRFQYELFGNRLPIIVAGDSAGGNLAAVMALRSRDLAVPAVELQILVYPVTDCDFDTLSYRDPANALILTREGMIWFWDHYAPDPVGRRHPDASPLRSPDMSRLPRALILTAEHDVLRDEGEVYATRLLKASVPVEHHRFEGQMHGFLSMLDVLPASGRAIGYIAEWVRSSLERVA